MSRADNKEKYKEYDHQYYIKHKRPKSKIGQAEQQIYDLEAKLAEKDKEIEKLTEELDYKNFWNDFVDLYTGNKLKTQMLHENCKDKISFAVEQLEKVKNYMITDEKDMFGANYLMNSVYVLEFIDDQIKKLKGE